MSKIVPRHKIVAFYGVSSSSTTAYYRMTKFTQLARPQNSIEYDRHYVDETVESNDVVGYNQSITYAFDKYRNLPVQEDIVNITNSELTGDSAVRSIVIVDTETKDAFKRDFAVIPNNEGDNINNYTYSGTFKCKGNLIPGVAETEDNYRTITFVPKAREIKGVPPISFIAEGEPLSDWHIRGAVGGVGKCGLNKLKQEPISISNGQPEGTQYAGTVSYGYAVSGPSIPSGEAFVSAHEQWLVSTYSKIIQISSKRMGVDDRPMTYDNCQYRFRLSAGSYKLVMEAIDHSGQWLSDRLSRYAQKDDWRGTPIIALLSPDSEVVIEEEFDRSLYQGDTFIHIEYPFTITENMEIGLWFRGIGHNISSEEFIPRFMVVPPDTVAEPFSVTVGTRTYEGVSCWEPYKLTLPIQVTGESDSEEIVINLDEYLDQDDIISMESTGIAISTYNGINTINVDSEVVPSEMFIKI